VEELGRVIQETIPLDTGKRHRIGIGGIAIESSTFSPLHATLDDFTILRGDAMQQMYPYLPDWTYRDRDDIAFIPCLKARSIPGGQVVANAYEQMKREPLDRIRDALPLDGFFFDVHGAMSVIGMDDAEADLAAAIRELVGDDCVISAGMDLHGNDTPGTVYLERDVNERDRHGRELTYIWFEINGNPYMLNHALINNGWAEDVDYGDRLYDKQLQDAAAFAQRHDLGVYGVCGAFGVALNDTQSQPVVQEPPAPVVQKSTLPVPPQSTGCDPNYTPCIPVYPPDLNCPDIGMTVQVIGSDPHGLDRDKDGFGCE
jgi:hypothetical protein